MRHTISRIPEPNIVSIANWADLIRMRPKGRDRGGVRIEGDRTRDRCTWQGHPVSNGTRSGRKPGIAELSGVILIAVTIANTLSAPPPARQPGEQRQLLDTPSSAPFHLRVGRASDRGNQVAGGDVSSGVWMVWDNAWACHAACTHDHRGKPS